MDSDGLQSGGRVWQRIFVCTMAGLFFVFILFSMLGIGGQSNIFFAEGGGYMEDTTKMLRDYLSGDSPYQTISSDPSRSGSYLPLSFLLYQALWLISGGASGTEALRLLTATFFSFGCFALLAWELWAMTERMAGGRRALLLCAALSVSGIAFYAVERGNFIVLTVALCAFFTHHYSDENRLLKELSFLALAVAAALKLAPALLGVMLLMEKRWKEAARLAVYGVVIAFAPFLCFGHIHLSLRAMLENLQTSDAISNSRFDAGRFGHRTLWFFADCLRISNATAATGAFYAGLARGLRIVFPALNYLAGGLALLTLPFQDGAWKKWMSLLLIMVLLPSFSILYAGLYLFPAAILFLAERRKAGYKKLDWACLFLLICILNPVQFCSTIPNVVHTFSKEPVVLNATALAANLAAYLLLILLAGGGVCSLSGKINRGRRAAIRGAAI